MISVKWTEGDEEGTMEDAGDTDRAMRASDPGREEARKG